MSIGQKYPTNHQHTRQRIMNTRHNIFPLEFYQFNVVEQVNQQNTTNNNMESLFNMMLEVINYYQHNTVKVRSKHKHTLIISAI